ncbi:MAG TPA: TIGR04283 family arsenosugar biosynthesis glycosyltransferase [Stellaceae bacterium]|nr:TIGR04283 family arsenosugar biosynthesis glycosyltransferase [Stellaceae bacterium]
MPAAADLPLSIVIPTLNAAASLGAALDSLDEARADLLREIVVVDGGSTDDTPSLARAGGAHVIAGPPGRGVQLAAGGAAATGEWLLFLHADTRLGRGWSTPVAAFIADPANRARAGYPRFCLDDPSRAARRIEAGVRWRCRRLALPFGDQGLLIAAALYRALGGFRPLPLMEDVDLVRRLGRRRLLALEADAVTSAERYYRDGYVLRPLRNFVCLTLYFLGVPPASLLRIYR